MWMITAADEETRPSRANADHHYSPPPRIPIVFRREELVQDTQHEATIYRMTRILLIDARVWCPFVAPKVA